MIISVFLCPAVLHPMFLGGLPVSVRSSERAERGAECRQAAPGETFAPFFFLPTYSIIPYFCRKSKNLHEHGRNKLLTESSMPEPHENTP